MSSLHPAIAHVYTYDAAEDKLTSELMRVPSGCNGYRRAPSPSLATTYSTPLRTLGKDTQGLIEVIPIGRGEIVYFVERGKARKSADLEFDGSSESESEKENENGGARRSRAVRLAMRKVREVERMARQLDAEMMRVDEEQEVMRAGCADMVSDDEDEDEDEDEDDEDDDESDDEEESEVLDVHASVSVAGAVCVVAHEGSDYEESEYEESEYEDGGDKSVGIMRVIESETNAGAMDDDEDDEDDEWEVCEVPAGVPDRALQLIGNEEDWDVSLFGRDEDEADQMDTEDAKQSENEQPEHQQQQPVTEVQVQVKNKNKIDLLKAHAQWTAPEDWELPIQPTPSTDFNIFKFGFGATLPTRTKTQCPAQTDEGDKMYIANIHRAPRKVQNWMLPDRISGTPTSTDRTGSHNTRADEVDQVADLRTRSRADTVEDQGADSRMAADASTGADVTTRADAETRTEAHAKTRADSRMEATDRTRIGPEAQDPTRTKRTQDSRSMDASRTRIDPRTIRGDSSGRTDADRTRVEPRPLELTRTRTTAPTRTGLKPDHGPRKKLTQLHRTDTNPIARPRFQEIRTAATQEPISGKKRKAEVEDDEDAPQDPQVAQALARTQSLAGLKFKKLKTSHTTDAVEKTKVTIPGPGAMTSHSAMMTSAGLPRKVQHIQNGRKRKNDERDEDSSEEEGALSDSSEDIPLAKRCKTTDTAIRTSAPQYHPRSLDPSRQAWKYGGRTPPGAAKGQRASQPARTDRRSPTSVRGRRVPSISKLACKSVGVARKISDELRRRVKGMDERLSERLSSHAQDIQRRLNVKNVKIPFSAGKARAPASAEAPLRTLAAGGSYSGGYGLGRTAGRMVVGAGGVRGGLDQPESYVQQRHQGDHV